MTELETYRPAVGAIMRNGDNLRAWADEFDAAAQIASALSLTDFIPDTLKRLSEDGRILPEATRATVAAALLTGQELGLGPMASLRSIDVVHGTPGLRAIAMRALVLSAGHDMWVEDATDTRVVVQGQRRGSERIQTCVWDEARARDLKLWDKPTWRMQRRNMLTARATAECARLVAPERILGLGYTAEELADGQMDQEVAERAPAATPAPRKRARRAQPPAAPAIVDAPLPPDPEPPMDEPPLDDDEPPPGDSRGRLISDAQLTALHAALGAAGITEREDKLATVSGILGVDITSTKNLTWDQASRCLDVIELWTEDDHPDAG
jgi:hypothetical protein